MNFQGSDEFVLFFQRKHLILNLQKKPCIIFKPGFFNIMKAMSIQFILKSQTVKAVASREVGSMCKCE
ncbi:MAG: hypothetical protein A2X25_04180 [Chloroflexi bacterium GWB2_49_20]|nr:MAG: hypothetical protein A2X25_04180 [Chloroflexi bacterium GWB2_49_20]OGN77894.1 MAG: hypothetical protein A2X26_02030 [Chloroflexi bacterium GWC2_49_37]OGN82725.1 MAG: hypothetical protein A2X27_09000 [Chloroflexi bacterium GWD2_49_16]HCM96119.1 hypothetical protein [Anaerolineae bacterium]